MSIKLALILVRYKTPDSEVKKIKSQLQKFKIPFKLYIHDNSIRNNGYAYGVNQCIKKAIKEGETLFLILNNDIDIKEISLKNIQMVLQKYDICGGVMLQNKKKYYGGKIDKWRLSGDLNLRHNSKIDYITGSLILIKKKVIEKIGLLDETYFMYYEDVDFCFRAKKSGFKIGISEDIIYNHFEKSLNNPEKEFFLKRNRFIFFLRNATSQQYLREFLRVPITLYEDFPFILQYLLWKIGKK